MSHFENYNQMRGFLDPNYTWNSENVQFTLGARLSKDPESKINKEIEYYHYDKKYKIGSLNDELPICVYSAGYKIWSKGKYKSFFESLERQNYTNFHIVYIDDFSPDDSAYKIYDFLD